MDLPSWFKKSHQDDARIVLYLSPKSVSVAGVGPDNSLLFCDTEETLLSNNERLSESLTLLSERYDLAGKLCRWVLDATDYQLLMSDEVDVPREEMAEALRWKLKDMFEFADDDRVIDIFYVPAYGVGGAQKKVYVVAASKQRLLRYYSVFESVLLKIESIDISHLAMRNLARFYFSDNPQIFLDIENNLCRIYIIHQGEIYVMRGLSYGMRDLAPSIETIENLLLEIQRSMDYCVSELKLGPAKELILSPSALNYQALRAQIDNLLDVKVLPIKLEDFLKIPDKLTEAINNYSLNCIGSAMYK